MPLLRPARPTKPILPPSGAVLFHLALLLTPTTHTATTQSHHQTQPILLLAQGTETHPSNRHLRSTTTPTQDTLISHFTATTTIALQLATYHPHHSVGHPNMVGIGAMRVIKVQLVRARVRWLSWRLVQMLIENPAF